jgi:hypothetical protein
MCILLAQVKGICWYQCDVSVLSVVKAVVQDCGVMIMTTCLYVCVY